MAILASGTGSILEYLLEKQSQAKLIPRVALLISDNPQCRAVQLAERYELPCYVVPLKDFPNFEEWDAHILDILLKAGIEFVFLAGFLKKIGPKVLNKFQGRIVNTHPSLLPLYAGKGMYGQRVHEAVLMSGDTETGASLHAVTESYDEGPVLAQVRVPVEAGDTLELLENRVKRAEKKLILEFLNNLTSKGSKSQ